MSSFLLHLKKCRKLALAKYTVMLTSGDCLKHIYVYVSGPIQINLKIKHQLYKETSARCAAPAACVLLNWLNTNPGRSSLTVVDLLPVVHQLVVGADAEDVHQHLRHWRVGQGRTEEAAGDWSSVVVQQ